MDIKLSSPVPTGMITTISVDAMTVSFPDKVIKVFYSKKGDNGAVLGSGELYLSNCFEEFAGARAPLCKKINDALSSAMKEQGIAI